MFIPNKPGTGFNNIPNQSVIVSSIKNNGGFIQERLGHN